MLPRLASLREFYLFPVWTIECVGAIIAKAAAIDSCTSELHGRQPAGQHRSESCPQATECGDHTYSLPLEMRAT